MSLSYMVIDVYHTAGHMPLVAQDNPSSIEEHDVHVSTIGSLPLVVDVKRDYSVYGSKVNTGVLAYDTPR